VIWAITSSSLNTESKGAEVGDFQGDVPAPSGMDRRCGQMDHQAGTRPRALAVDEADEARVIARRADQFLRLPEEKAARLDEDTIAIPIDLLIRIARLAQGEEESRILKGYHIDISMNQHGE
jgi:hypothetical protein